MYDFAYSKPASVADAVAVLAKDGDAKALAGGMTYIPVLKQRLAKPSQVVDLSGCGLSGISVAGGKVTIGAMTRHCEVAASADVQKAIHRIQPLATVKRAVDRLRENGIDAIRRKLARRVADPALPQDRRKLLQRTLDEAQESPFERGCRWWFTD